MELIQPRSESRLRWINQQEVGLACLRIQYELLDSDETVSEHFCVYFCVDIFEVVYLDALCVFLCYEVKTVTCNINC